MPTLELVDDAAHGIGESSLAARSIRVGYPRGHGMMDEIAKFPPPGVTYSFVRDKPVRWKLVRSPIPAYLQHVDSPDHDLLETILVPILTRNDWILSIEC